jgi:folate-binding protein YgfZ
MHTLTHLGLLRFSGADAITFLQGQVSNDTRPLSSGTPVLAAYSTPQGRVVAVLRLLPHSSGVLAVLPRDLADSTLERLRKYVMRSKVKIENVGATFAVIGLSRADASTLAGLPLPDASHAYVEQNGIGVTQVGHDAERLWLVGEASALEAVAPHVATRGADPAASDTTRTDSVATPSTTAATDSAAENAWRLADIRAGFPQVYSATQEQFVAQMLNLDLIDGISFTKGCYTGQEIIARTQHLGRIKRRLFRIGLPEGGTFAVGQSLQLADGRSARLTEVARTDNGYEALAVLTLEAAAADTGASDPRTANAGNANAAIPIVGNAAAGIVDSAAQALAAGAIAITELALPYSLK